MFKIILASTSPRRKELLEREGIDFIIDASSIDEIMDESLSIPDRLCKLASEKAKPIHDKYPTDIVIGADTVVCLDNNIIGKAKDKQDAYKILSSLSSQTHSVYTAIAIYNKDTLYTICDETKVSFKDITNMIDDYLSQDEWMGKAGAYAIQGIAGKFVDKVDGDIDTVIGLPVRIIVDYFKENSIIE